LSARADVPPVPSAPPDSYSFVRYLRAKESVDDAALHRPTMDRFGDELSRLSERRARPPRIVDVGAGVGSMFRRLRSWDVLPDGVTYVVLDADADAVAAAREMTQAWAERNGRAVSSNGRGGLSLPESDTAVRFVAADAFDHLAGETYDALVGHAFVDLIDLPEGLSALLRGVDPGGVCYFPITFDGETTFDPVDDAATTRAVLDAYHATMDDRGTARSGRALLDAVVAAGAEPLAAGGSDWVVSPPYDDDRAYFLHHVLRFVERSVGRSGLVDEDVLGGWIARKRRAVAAEELTYLARNVDVLCRAP
jgi:hypothetical protein